MAKWIDTRPRRPEGEYLVMGHRFEGGVAEIAGNPGPHARAAFAALGIVPEPAEAAPEQKPVKGKSKG